MRSRAVLALSWLGFVVLCNGVGFVSALAGGEPSYYQELARPSWAPPPSVFAPVWTILYTMMGTATWLVWLRARGAERRRAMTAFAVQLGLNAAWTPVFFGLHQPGLAVAVIVGVLVAVLAMLVVYARISRWAGALVVPLALWVAFATCLNLALWWLNRPAAVAP
ncbi:MAG: tryptophan-rich sensory protein [Myxococcales bacterium]|nr:tryptophan-rich sensory protein [Myxococcales bacterium]